MLPSRSWSRRSKTRPRAASPSRPSTGELDGAADLAAEVDERAGEVLLAEVEPDDEAGVVVDLEEDRGLAAARRPAADLADDAVVEERR